MIDSPNIKVAIVHEYLNQHGGAERCLEVFHEMFPAAPIYTLVYNKKLFPQCSSWDIRPSILQSFPLIKKHYKYYFPLFPFVVKTFNLSSYDVVITISHAWVKGIRKSNAVHISYCLTPVRYAWDLYDEYLQYEFIPIVFKMMMPFLAWCLRSWDRWHARRVDRLIAISQTVQDRIQQFYDMPSDIIYPPVSTSFYTIDDTIKREEFYLVVSRLKAYKRIDLVVEAFKKLKKRLVIIGNGSELHSLRERAAGVTNIVFHTDYDDAQVRSYYRRAKGFIFAGLEDFGIVNVEAQLCGLPVIAFNGGGARETVHDGITGVLFNHQTPESLCEAITRFECMTFDAMQVRVKALSFNIERFKKEFTDYIKRYVATKKE